MKSVTEKPNGNLKGALPLAGNSHASGATLRKKFRCQVVEVNRCVFCHGQWTLLISNAVPTLLRSSCSVVLFYVKIKLFF